MTSSPSPLADPAAFDTWIFDLDNTLYPATVDLFAQMDQRMKTFIARTLGLSPDEAFRLQRDYYHRYGTSLRGLMQEHAIDPAVFLAEVHDIDHSGLAPDPVLESALARLPGRKIIYTNATVAHAERVLDRLGVASHFCAIYDIVAANYIPKPQFVSYDGLISLYNITPQRAIMFEDVDKNLAPAAARGMTTVWVRNRVHWSATERGPSDDTSHCHHVTENLGTWLASLIDSGTALAPAAPAPA